MNTINTGSLSMGITLTGTLPDDEIINEMVTVPFRLIRRGDKGLLNEPAKQDVLKICLADWETEQGLSFDDPQLLTGIATINQLSQWIATLDRSQVKATFYLTTTRIWDQGGFSFPATLMHAISAANLEFEMLILVVLDDDEDANSVSRALRDANQ